MGGVVDYSKLDSRSLLLEGAKADEALNYAWGVLLAHGRSLVAEVTANGMSERAKQIEAEAAETRHEYRMLRLEASAIDSEIDRRIWHNKANGNFAQLKIGLLRKDGHVQNEAMCKLHELFGGILKKKGWFHPEEEDGIDSLANVLLVKELNRHGHLDLPSTLEYAMDNRFAYLNCAFIRDFKDELDKLSRRPVEIPLDPKLIDSTGVAGQRLDRTRVIDDEILRHQRVIRLRELAMEQAEPIHREIILTAGELLGSGDLLTAHDRAIRAYMVSRVSAKLGHSEQWVRRKLNMGTGLREIKQVLSDAPEGRFKVILTDGDGK